MVKLSSRQRDFLGRLFDLSHEAAGPVRYVEVARALDVNPVTAYEMLRLLEDKGLVRSETVRPQGRKSRSVVVFSPTEKAAALLAELTGGSLSEQEWEKARSDILPGGGEGRRLPGLAGRTLTPHRRTQIAASLCRRHGHGHHSGFLRTAGSGGGEKDFFHPAAVWPAGMGSALLAGRVQSGPLAGRKGQPERHVAVAFLLSTISGAPGQFDPGG